MPRHVRLALCLLAARPRAGHSTRRDSTLCVALFNLAESKISVDVAAVQRYALLYTSLIQTNVGFVRRRIQTKVPVRAGPRRILATFVWISRD